MTRETDNSRPVLIPIFDTIFMPEVARRLVKESESPKMNGGQEHVVAQYAIDRAKADIIGLVVSWYDEVKALDRDRREPATGEAGFGFYETLDYHHSDGGEDWDATAHADEDGDMIAPARSSDRIAREHCIRAIARQDPQYFTEAALVIATAR